MLKKNKKSTKSFIAILLSVIALIISIAGLFIDYPLEHSLVWILLFIAMIFNWWQAESDFLEEVKDKCELVEKYFEAERKVLGVKEYLQTVENEFIHADQDEFTTEEIVEFLDKEMEKWNGV